MKRWADISDAWENTTTPAEKLMVISAKTRGDRVIWSIVAFLTILSLLAVYSATGSLAYKYNKGNTEYYLYKQIAFIAAGVGIIYFTHLLNYRWFSRFALWLYIIS
ncbi:MAG TPA: cell division protein FtsW, partial [Phnomibacter sp.]|nr:cell division protein FtsW [Phnomibacter sp.]